MIGGQDLEARTRLEKSVTVPTVLTRRKSANAKIPAQMSTEFGLALEAPIRLERRGNDRTVQILQANEKDRSLVLQILLFRPWVERGPTARTLPKSERS